MADLWIKVIKNHRIRQSATIPLDSDNVQEALQEQLLLMDLPNPIWLDKHAREFERFYLTVFLPGDFIEAVNFDKIEIVLVDGNDKRKSNDPRNDFS